MIPEAAIRAFAESLPEAWEDHPWGESAYKVGKKTFTFVNPVETDAGSRLSFSVKLGVSHDEAMTLDWVAETGYGWGRGGWVTCTVRDDAPIDMLLDWVEESYRLVAPKKLVRALDQQRA